MLGEKVNDFSTLMRYFCRYFLLVNFQYFLFYFQQGLIGFIGPVGETGLAGEKVSLYQPYLILLNSD